MYVANMRKASYGWGQYYGDKRLTSYGVASICSTGALNWAGFFVCVCVRTHPTRLWHFPQKSPGTIESLNLDIVATSYHNRNTDDD